MIHPHTELRFINREIGFGVFATQFIPRGTLTWVCDELDQFVDPARVAALPPNYRKLLDTYTFRDRLGRHVLCWDLARFVNHSCARAVSVPIPASRWPSATSCPARS